MLPTSTTALDSPKAAFSSQINSGAGQTPVHRMPSGPSLSCKETETRRKPTFCSRFEGSLLLRLAERQFLASLFKLPPRSTRFRPLWRLTFIFKKVKFKKFLGLRPGMRGIKNALLRPHPAQAARPSPPLVRLP